jgi:hypothetical protein
MSAPREKRKWASHICSARPIWSSVLPGFWLNPAWLWEAEARDPLLTLMEIRGLSAEAAAQVRDLLLGGPGE